jgi:hypothetical protein
VENRFFKGFILIILIGITLGFGYMAFKEFRIWLLGDRLECEIVSIQQIDSDLFKLSFLMDNPADKYSLEIERMAYNHLKNDTILKVIALGRENPKFIFPELESRDLFRSWLGLFFFGFLSIKALRNTFVRLDSK